MKRRSLNATTPVLRFASIMVAAAATAAIAAAGSPPVTTTIPADHRTGSTAMTRITLESPEVVDLQEVPLTDVTIDDGFWTPRRETNRKVSLAHSLDMLEKAGNILDLQLAAQGKHEGYQGPVYMDSDLYKCVEAVSYSLAANPDPILQARLDRIIDLIAAAQQPDGYLDTWYIVNQPADKRFTNLRDHHEMYCAGHLFEAAVANYQATGDRKLLDVALKYADLLCNTFGNGPHQREGYPGHPEIELALVKLYRVTGSSRYLQLAAYFINTRGDHFFATEHNTPADQYDGDYWQDSCPVRELTDVAGHAVRFGYLMSGCTDIGVLTHDDALLDMVRTVAASTLDKNTYITGGIGSSAGNEGFTTDYDLPNLSAYQETCASVAMVRWNHRMNLAFGGGGYADAMETALYNGVLDGVSLDGRRFFYINPLASLGHHHRSEWFSCACCPPNVTRTLAELGNFIYARDNEGLYVNLFVQGRVHTKVGGDDLTISVTTKYPWDGGIAFTFDKPTGKAMDLHVRLPHWCAAFDVKYNGVAERLSADEHDYLSVRRDWKKGDTFEVNLEMPVRQVQAGPNVKEDLGMLALARGPLIYCIEGVDIDEAPFWSFAVPAGADLTTRWRLELLGGVVTIEGHATVAAQPDWEDGHRLYRSVQRPKTVAFQAIPYYAWDNRQPGPMRVWIPASPPPPKIQTLATRARVSMSFVNSNCQPEAIHDQREPASSGEKEQPTANCHWWPHKGGVEWVQYTWDKPVEISQSSVYWFDDTGRGACRIPASCRLLYRSLNDGTKWIPVDTIDSCDVATDRWNIVHFSQPVRTTALRLEVHMQDGWAAGVQEWKVDGPP